MISNGKYCGGVDDMCVCVLLCVFRFQSGWCRKMKQCLRRILQMCRNSGPLCHLLSSLTPGLCSSIPQDSPVHSQQHCTQHWGQKTLPVTDLFWERASFIEIKAVTGELQPAGTKAESLSLTSDPWGNVKTASMWMWSDAEWVSVLNMIPMMSCSREPLSNYRLNCNISNQ